MNDITMQKNLNNIRDITAVIDMNAKATENYYVSNQITKIHELLYNLEHNIYEKIKIQFLTNRFFVVYCIYKINPQEII